MADRVEKTNINLKGESMPAFMGENASIDWRGRPCKSNKHGGMTAAVFVLGLSLSLSLFLSLFLLWIEQEYPCILFTPVPFNSHIWYWLAVGLKVRKNRNTN
jgi:hypothetical protein